MTITITLPPDSHVHGQAMHQIALLGKHDNNVSVCDKQEESMEGTQRVARHGVQGVIQGRQAQDLTSPNTRMTKPPSMRRPSGLTTPVITGPAYEISAMEEPSTVYRTTVAVPAPWGTAHVKLSERREPGSTAHGRVPTKTATGHGATGNPEPSRVTFVPPRVLIGPSDTTLLMLGPK